jgi:type IV pilus assembly protein PilM
VSSFFGHFATGVKGVQAGADTQLRTPMAFSLRKNSSGGTVGLDIDGRYLAAAQVESGRVVRGATLELPSGLVHDGEVVDRDRLADALRDFVASAGLPKSVRLGVANQQIVVRVVELPRIEDGKEREAAVRFQAAEAIAMPLDEAVLDHQIAGYAEAPDGSPRMQVVLVAARRSMLEAVLDAAKKAGLKPEGIDLDAFALVRTLASASEEGPEDSARVYCHLGGVSNLAIAVGTSCFFTRPLSAVWDDDDAGARLADEIRLSIDYYMTQGQAKPVGEVVLSGPGSIDDQLVESLGLHLGLPTRVAAPLGVLDSSALAGGEDPHRLTVAAGLAMGAAA